MEYSSLGIQILNHLYFRLLASLTLARILMTFSRRTMYFTSMILTIICLLLFSTFSYLISTSGRQERVSSLQLGSLLSSCLLVISVQLGVQTLPLLLSGEIFPADVRATCKVIQMNHNTSFLILLFYYLICAGLSTDDD